MAKGKETAKNPPGASAESEKLRPPVLEHRTVRRVLALGQALGLEPLHVPLHVEQSPAAPAPAKGEGEEPGGGTNQG